MIGYIRNAQTFETIKTVDVIDYNLPIEVPSGYTGTIKIVKTEGKFQNYIISIEDESFTGTDAWYITGQDTEIGEEITLTVADIWESFYDSDIINVSHSQPSEPPVYANGARALYETIKAFLGIDEERSGTGSNATYHQVRKDVIHSKYSCRYTILNRFLDITWANTKFGSNTTNFADSIKDEILRTIKCDAEDIGKLLYYDESWVIFTNKFSNARKILNDHGLLLKAAIKPTQVDEYQITEIAVGDGIECEGTKYRIFQIVTPTVFRVEVDNDVVCNFYAVSPPYLDDFRYLNFRSYNVRRKAGTEPAPVRTETISPSLYVDIDRIDFTPIPIVFGDGHSEVISQKYDDENVVSFITLFAWRLISQSSSASHWEYKRIKYYLTEDANITDDESLQCQGQSTEVSLEGLKTTDITWQQGLEYVQDEFLKNKWEHKVEFASDKIYRLGQPVRLVLDRGILDTTISSVYKKSTDDRWLYTCGDLPLTASEQIKDNSWSYGRRLPLNPVKGQLAFD